MTNLVYFATVLLTTNVPTGDTMRLGGTNYVQYVEVVTPQTLILEVQLCTNRTIYKTGESTTNAPIWYVRPPPPVPNPYPFALPSPPPLPGPQAPTPSLGQ